MDTVLVPSLKMNQWKLGGESLKVSSSPQTVSMFLRNPTSKTRDYALRVVAKMYRLSVINQRELKEEMEAP